MVRVGLGLEEVRWRGFLVAGGGSDILVFRCCRAPLGGYKEFRFEVFSTCVLRGGGELGILGNVRRVSLEIFVIYGLEWFW